MNCDDYLKQLLEDPASTDAEMDDHVQDCESCYVKRDAAREFDDRIQASLKMDIDPQVVRRIRALPEQQLQRRRAWYRPMLIGTTVAVLAVTMVVVWLGNMPNEVKLVDDLHILAVEHIDAEVASLQYRQEVQPGQVAALLSELGGVLTRDIPGVVYAAPCLIREHPGLHLVVRKNGWTVSILMMPGEFMASQERIMDDHFTGLVTPTSYGSLAVVSDDNGAVDAIVRQVKESVMWGS